MDLPPLDPDLRERLLAPPEGLVEVVLDTDVTNEIDDQFALVWALLRPDRLRVRALHAAPYSHATHLVTDPALVTDLERQKIDELVREYGNVMVLDAADGVAKAAQECRVIADLCGSDVPVVQGCAAFLPDEQTPVAGDAVDSLIALAHEDREGPLHVLAIGAATNVASAVLTDPTIRERISVVWTSAYPSFWPQPNRSFNLVQDLPASRVLLESGVPFVYLPGYYVGEQLRVSLPELREHVRGKGAVGDYLYDLAEQSPFLGTERGRSKIIWDLVNVAWVLEPSWLSTGWCPPRRSAATCAGRTRGRTGTACGRPWGVDRDAVYSDLFRVLADL
jgi:hypothetical protein